MRNSLFRFILISLFFFSISGYVSAQDSVDNEQASSKFVDEDAEMAKEKEQMAREDAAQKKKFKKEIKREQDPDDLYDMLLFGIDLYKEKNYDLALDEFKRFLYIAENEEGMFEKLAEVHFWLGMVYLNQARYRRAIIEFNNIVVRYESSRWAPNAAFQIGKLYYTAYTKNNLGYTYKETRGFKVEDRETVVSRLLMLKEIFPDSRFVDAAYFLIASLYEFTKEYDKAIQYYQKIIDEYPESPKLINARQKITELSLK